MKPCCPPGEGCNARGGPAPCALTLLRNDASPQARDALRLWARCEEDARAGRSTRFARRAYARARDRALGLWTPWGRSAHHAA